MRNWRLRIAIIAAVSAAVFSSCTMRSTLRLEQLSVYTRDNNYLPAIKAIQKQPKMYGNNNTFLYNMDIGALYHYAKMYDSSTAYLMKASDILNELFARSITNEAAAIMTNDNVRPYRSKPYEIVMLHQFLASNFLAQGNPEGALVETRRVQLLFDEWNRKNTRKEEKYDSDGMFHYVSSIAYDAANETSDAMISLYHSVKAFQAGPVALPSDVNNRAYYLFQMNDRENDNKLLNITPTIDKNAIPGLENNASEIIFIGYAGRGPYLVEESWWGTWIKDGLLVINHTDSLGTMHSMSLPAPSLPVDELKKAEKGKKTASGTTFHIKFALPTVKTVPSLTSHFQIRCSGDTHHYTSTVINDLDKQAIKYGDDTRNSTLLRTVIRVVLRTIAAEKAKSEMKSQNAAANLLLNIGTDLLSDQLEKADTRICFLLPKTVQIVRIPVAPGVYTIDAEAMDYHGSALANTTFPDISVGKHEKRFVFYSSFK